MRRSTKILGGVFLLGIVAGALLLVSTLRYGLSAFDEPTRIEHVLARAMRRYAVLADARAHFADQCAVCHGKDGKNPRSPAEFEAMREEAELWAGMQGGAPSGQPPPVSGAHSHLRREVFGTPPEEARGTYRNSSAFRPVLMASSRHHTDSTSASPSKDFQPTAR